MNASPMRIVVIGSGNVAYHLAPALANAGHRVLRIFGRNLQAAQNIARAANSTPTDQWETLQTDADVYLIAVADKAIAEVAGQLSGVTGIVAHTSGNAGMEVFGNNPTAAGIFYPLQSFSIRRKADISTVPFCIEAGSENAGTTLFQLASSLSGSVQYIDSEQRRLLHLAAVFANNFSNQCFAIADAWLKQHELSLDLLRPLIAETASKVLDHPPAEMQTGPAIRGDQAVMNTHIRMLRKHPEWQKIYTLLSESITQHGY